MREYRGSFEARAVDGTEHTIEMYVAVELGTTITELETDEGIRVRWIERGKYAIQFQAGEVVVTSTDPNAP